MGWCAAAGGWVGMAVVWVVVIALVVWVVSRLFPRAAADETRQVLDERLAAGQIDVAEYRRLREPGDQPSPMR